MKITGDLSLIKKINKSIVLEAIIKKSPISRAAIAQMTGLTKATVSTLVNELIESKLACEIGTGQSSGGRKPVLLLFNKAAGCAVGIDLGVNYILSVLTDLEGNIIEESRIPLADLSIDSVIAELKASIRALVDRAPASPYGIVGIGIGVPGITDDKGTLLFAPNLGWENLHIQEIIEKEFHIPVTIDNEANAGAIGEKQFGAGQKETDLIYISVGIGIGTGIIIKGELYRGSSGFSGEMGHISIEANGRKCRCGNLGCWELYASENALFEQAHALLPLSFPAGQTAVDIALLVHLAEQGTEEVIRLFAQMGQYLGLGVINIMNTFNPKLIIIGSRLTAAEPWLKGSLLQVIEARSLPYSRRHLRIEFSTLRTHSAVLGASFLAISQFFSTMKVSVES